jgi:hypothetical protein
MRKPSRLTFSTLANINLVAATLLPGATADLGDD